MPSCLVGLDGAGTAVGEGIQRSQKMKSKNEAWASLLAVEVTFNSPGVYLDFRKIIEVSSNTSTKCPYAKVSGIRTAIEKKDSREKGDRSDRLFHSRACHQKIVNLFEGPPGDITIVA